MAALVAIPVFELSLFLSFYTTSGSKGATYFYLLVPAWVHVIFIGTAVVVGLIFGFKGITWLLGHLFLTHFENERNERITVALWAAIIGVAAIAYFAAHRA
ncbi:MAG: hypothetical protein AB9M53_02710 [Leptothrix sp. (in: b-proteobacteria)]